MNTQQDSDLFGTSGDTPNQHVNSNAVKINYNPLPRPTLSDTSATPPSDTSPKVADDGGRWRTEVNDVDGQRPPYHESLSDRVGQNHPVGEEKDVGHDQDLPARDHRHALSTFEAARIFEEAECRVSERTIIRWCNKNKKGTRRLDCAFDIDDRKYYIAEDSVKAVIRDERSKGRQSEQYNPDLSDIDEVSDINNRHESDYVGHQQPKASDKVGQWQTHESANVEHRSQEPSDTREREEAERRTDGLAEENVRLKIELAKLEEQGKTKDEMMTFLRKEIDRRGDQVLQDRETYNQSLDWFRKQVEAKDTAIAYLNNQMRGLLEAPKAPSREQEPPGGERTEFGTREEKKQQQ
jgi:hypothetical protein